MTDDPSTLFGPAGPLLPAYEAVDWSATPLGAVEKWSGALRGAVDTLLRSRFPITLFWGPEFVMLYNEAYVELIGDKHPGALGAPAQDVFAEAWYVIGPMMQKVIAGGGATWVENEYVPLLRHGFVEECYFTFSYSPVHGPDGQVEGVMDIAVETTAQVLARRRQELLGRLAEELAHSTDLFDRDELDDRAILTDLAERAIGVLGSDPADMPVVNLLLPGVPPVTTQPDMWLPAPAGPTTSRLVTSDSSDGTKTVWLPLQDRGRGGPLAHSTLVVRCSHQLPFDRNYQVFLRLLADVTAQALGRLAIRAAERSLHEQERSLSTTLQRSLLTRPAQPDHLQVAVRYEPAVDSAEVGGDWYDAFLLPDGDLAIAIGDVAGHDRDAAAAMAQTRNLLRGIAYTLGGSPATVMAALDRAMVGLGQETVATGVFARLEQSADRAEAGVRLLRWTNAGHPPPALIGPDGTVTLLDDKADLLLGVEPGIDRIDRTLLLEPGAMVVLYTDGLVERRGQILDVGFDWLRTTLAGHATDDPEHIADLLLARMLPGAEDDVALLVLRADPER